MGELGGGAEGEFVSSCHWCTPPLPASPGVIVLQSAQRTPAPEYVLGIGVVCRCRSILVVPYDFAMADPLAAGNTTGGDAVRAGFSV